MIWGLVQILLFQGIGELISQFALPTLPGPVIGLVLLIIWLVLRKEINADLAMVADGFSQYFGCYLCQPLWEWSCFCLNSRPMR